MMLRYRLYRLSGWPRLRAWWQATPTMHLPDRLLVGQKKASWGHFHREIEEDARRRLALTAERRRA